MSSCRIVFCGCVEFSRHCLEQAIRHGADIVAVFTRPRSDEEFNSDHADLEPAAHALGIPVHRIGSLNSDEARTLLRGYSPDLLFVWGWSELVDGAVLGIPTRGAVGAHPALLPANRGRHPLIWAVQLGLKRTGLTFFWMDCSADGGDILAQVEVPLSACETAASLYARIEAAASTLMPQLIQQLASGSGSRTPQDRSKASRWRRRSKEDGRVDFRMSGTAIDRLVRALGPPYPGAHVALPGRDVRIWRVTVAPVGDADENTEFGRVLRVDGRNVLVRADDAIVTLVDHDFDPLPAPGSYL